VSNGWPKAISIQLVFISIQLLVLTIVLLVR